MRIERLLFCILILFPNILCGQVICKLYDESSNDTSFYKRQADTVFYYRSGTDDEHWRYILGDPEIVFNQDTFLTYLNDSSMILVDFRRDSIILKLNGDMCKAFKGIGYLKLGFASNASIKILSDRIWLNVKGKQIKCIAILQKHQYWSIHGDRKYQILNFIDTSSLLPVFRIIQWESFYNSAKNTTFEYCIKMN